MSQSSVKEKSQTLSDLCARVEIGEPVLFEHDGKRYAIITNEDLEIFEELENQADLIAAQNAIDEMKSSGEKPIPFEEILKENGLCD